MSLLGEAALVLEQLLEDQEAEVAEAYEAGRRHQRLADALMWPWLRRRSAVEDAYRDGRADGFSAGVAFAERRQLERAS